MLTLTTEPNEPDDGTDEGIQRYNAMLATIGYGPGRYEDDSWGGRMNTNVTVFEPTNDGDDGADAIMLVAKHEDRQVSFVVDSGAQAF